MIATAATIEQRWEQGTRTHLFSSAVEIAVAAEGRLDDAAMKSSSSASLTKMGWAGGENHNKSQSLKGERLDCPMTLGLSLTMAGVNLTETSDLFLNPC